MNAERPSIGLSPSALILTALCIAQVGCSSMQASDQTNVLAAQMNSMIGKQARDLVLEYGTATDRTEEGDVLILRFRRNLDPKAVAFGSGNSTLIRQYDQYDDQVFFLVDGRVSKWKLTVKRGSHIVQTSSDHTTY